MLLSSVAFVGCTATDFAPQINDLQKQITDNKAAITALQKAMDESEAPQEETAVTVTINLTDAWGTEHSIKTTITLAAAKQ